MIDFIFEQLNNCLDEEEKYWAIIKLGKQSPNLAYNQKIDTNKVTGCQSNVWLISNIKDNKFYFQADSDSFLVKGLAYIATEFYSGKTNIQIQNLEPTFISGLGLDKYITASRVNGVHAIIHKIKQITID